MAALQEFFYDGQIERFLAQFIRMVSGFQVEFGRDSNGVIGHQRVPVYWGDSSRQVQSIISNNSGGSMLPVVPAMTVYINNLKYDRDRVQSPTFEGKMHIRERFFNEVTQEYENRQGNAFTVERMMPVPYSLELKMDIWTSNTRQKLQMVEQLVTLFNPDMEIQNTDNYIDWTSLSAVFLDDTSWTSRTVPIGTENPIDVASITFKLPIWISPPAKVKKLGVIQKIIANVHDAEGNLNESIFNEDNLLGNRQYFTPLRYGVMLVGNELTLLKISEFADPRDPTVSTQTKVGTPDKWAKLINMYGQLTDGISQVRLLQDDGISEVIGTVSYNPTDETKLIFNIDIDTKPSNSLAPITAIIDPTQVTVDSSITTPATGTRFLILDDIGSYNNGTNGAVAWKGNDGSDLIAYANDIIEFDGNHWNVTFDSQTDNSLQYVSNLTTSTQYKWDGNQWVKSFEGEYKEGIWTLVL